METQNEKEIDYTGIPFGHLIVLNHINRTTLNCQCICGKIRKYNIGLLKNHKYTSCGCINNPKNTNSYQYISKTREYRIWSGIKDRCYNPNSNTYSYYGDKGITMSDEWFSSFDTFFTDMGICPDKHSIDRIDNTLGYFKGNCRWATSKQQNNNKSSNKYITFQGKTQTLTEWCTELKLNINTIRIRLYIAKMPVAVAFYRRDLLDNTRHNNKLSDYVPASKKPNYNNDEFKNKL